MEGLIPLLYKAIKDRRSNAGAGAGGGRAYRTGGAFPSAAPMDLDDPEQRRRWLQQELRSPVHAVGHAATASAAVEEGSLLHRRTLSLEELAGEVGQGLSPDRRLRVPLPKARSVRAFACIGAA